MERILHQLRCIKPCKWWDKLPIHLFSGAGCQPSTVLWKVRPAIFFMAHLASNLPTFRLLTALFVDHLPERRRDPRVRRKLSVVIWLVGPAFFLRNGSKSAESSSAVVSGLRRNRKHYLISEANLCVVNHHLDSEHFRVILRDVFFSKWLLCCFNFWHVGKEDTSSIFFLVTLIFRIPTFSGDHKFFDGDELW